MTEHYTRNTESTTAYCNKCGRPTQHAVSWGRRGRCLEHETELSKKDKARSEKKEKEAKNPRLF
jgi:hypothetical protein